MPVTIISIRDMVQSPAIIHRTPRGSGRVPALLLSLLLGAACAGGERADGLEVEQADTAAPATASDTNDPVPADTGDSPRADEKGEQPARGAEWTAEPIRADATVQGAAVLRAIRTARHDGFDRIVLDFGDAAAPGHRVRFVDPPARQCGSGDAVTVSGSAVIMITTEPAYAHTEEGRPTVRERSRMPGLPALAELNLICDFEAVVELVAGVTSRTRYRAFTLSAPTRIVVDIAHPAAS